MATIWFYGLPLTDDIITAYAKKKQVIGVDDADTFFMAVEEASYELEMYDIIIPRVGVDLVDHKMHKMIVLHINESNETEYTSKDEERLRKLLGIEERGRWFRCIDHCDFDMLDVYVPPPNPA